MNGKKTAAIVIPAYRSGLSEHEAISLRRCAEIFPGYDRYLVVPQQLDISAFLAIDPGLKHVYFDPAYFRDVYSYSRLCRKSEFYKPFTAYRYMLLHQLDCFVFRNELDAWCGKNYDYIGAPWIKPAWLAQFAKDIRIPFFSKIFRPVGNGGFSLRNTGKMQFAARLLWPVASRIKFNEDLWWSNFASRVIPFFRIPDQGTALEFAFDDKPGECFRLNGERLPFGCHAWEKHIEFWRPHFKRFGYDI